MRLERIVQTSKQLGKQAVELIKALEYNYKYEQKVTEAADFIRNKLGNKIPLWAITLGSGLGDIADRMTDTIEIDYSEIPNFPTPTVEGHDGKLVIGDFEGVPIIGLKGRKHFYEIANDPNAMQKVVFPVHVMAELGIQNYFATNAAGGLNPGYEIADMMEIRSHISKQPDPLLGKLRDFRRVDNGERGFRFQPLSNEYDPEYRELLREAADEFPGKMHTGTYIAVTGSSYETKAECVMYRDAWKGDAVGMSTAPEIIIAKSRGMKTVGMTCITNKIQKSNDPEIDGTNAANHDEVKRILESPEVRHRLSTTVSNFFKLYKHKYMN